MIETARKINRTLLELYLGMIFLGLLCWVIGAFFVKNQYFYAISLWFGVLTGCVNATHMNRTLEKALYFDEAGASKTVTGGYLFRYFALVVLFAIIMITKVMDPLVVFLGCMTLKGAAYLQPFTHKLCNKIFRETDPVPEPLPEENLPEKKE